MSYLKHWNLQKNNKLLCLYSFLLKFTSFCLLGIEQDSCPTPTSVKYFYSKRYWRRMGAAPTLTSTAILNLKSYFRYTRPNLYITWYMFNLEEKRKTKKNFKVRHSPPDSFPTLWGGSFMAEIPSLI